MRRALMITTVAAALVAGAVPGASASTGWAIQPTPTPTDGVDGQLLAVSCTSTASCTAVGNYTSDSGQVTLAEYWDGSTWTVQPTPNPAPAGLNILFGVSCTSATSCIAVGSYRLTDNSASLPMAEQWDGSTWTILSVPSPSDSVSANLRAVSCASATSCTAVGAYERNTLYPVPTLAEYWDGSTWTIQSTPSPSPGEHGASLTGVSCTAPDKCTAVGYFLRPGKGNATLAEQHYGSNWRIVSGRSSSALAGQLFAVSCSGRNNCEAVGAGDGGSLAENWNGTAWTAQTTPSPTQGFLQGVSCAGKGDCTAVGFQAGSALAERYSGGTWRIQPPGSPSSAEQLNGVSCSLPSTCTAVGAYTRADNPLAEQN
jgi:hypothetical protein